MKYNISNFLEVRMRLPSFRMISSVYFGKFRVGLNTCTRDLTASTGNMTNQKQTPAIPPAIHVLKKPIRKPRLQLNFLIKILTYQYRLFSHVQPLK